MLTRIDRLVRESLKEYLINRGGFSFAVPDYGTRFSAVVDQLTEELRDKGLRAPRWLTALAAARVLLGPVGSDDQGPPVSVQLAMLHALRRLEPDPRRRNAGLILDFSIAFGAGAWRETPPGVNGWEQRWAPAISALADLILPFVSNATNWLNRSVVGFKEAFGHESFSLKQGDSADRLTHRMTANSLAMHLAMPVTILEINSSEPLVFGAEPGYTSVPPILGDGLPAGTKLVFSVTTAMRLEVPEKSIDLKPGTKVIIGTTDTMTAIRLIHGENQQRVDLLSPQQARLVGPGVIEGWTCRCANEKCRERHRLDGWRPQVASLTCFCAAAVKGPRTELGAKSFATSLYFADLAHSYRAGGRLRLVTVAYHECVPPCQHPSGSGTPTRFESGECHVCRRPFDRTTTWVVSAERLIIVGTNPALYSREQRYRCPVCGNLYQIEDQDLRDATRCERCGRDLWDECVLRQFLAGAQTRLAQARMLDHERRRLAVCPHGACGHPLRVHCWCSLHSTITDHGSAHGLPNAATTVWCRTGFRSVPYSDTFLGEDYNGKYPPEDAVDEDETPEADSD